MWESGVTIHNVAPQNRGRKLDRNNRASGVVLRQTQDKLSFNKFRINQVCTKTRGADQRGPISNYRDNEDGTAGGLFFCSLSFLVYCFCSNWGTGGFFIYPERSRKVSRKGGAMQKIHRAFGGSGPHTTRPKHGPCSSTVERCSVKAMVGGANPLRDPKCKLLCILWGFASRSDI